MKKVLRSVLSLFLLVLPMVAFAQEETKLKQYDRVQINLHDGSEYIIPIDNYSSMKSYFIESLDAYVVDVDGCDAIYRFIRDEISTMKFIEYVPSSTGIEQLVVEDKHATLANYEDGKLVYGSPLIGKTAEIYNLSGALVSKVVLGETRALTFENLPQGAYVIKVEGYTFKIMKR